MNRFSRWFANFMRGRYGMDSMNRFLLVVAFVLIVADWILRWRILDLLTLALLIYIYCRMFSRNIYARQRENQRFLEEAAQTAERAEPEGAASVRAFLRRVTRAIRSCDAPDAGKGSEFPRARATSS